MLLCQQIILDTLSNQKNKIDSAELNHIKYGLFSINQWKEKLAVIITDELNKLSLLKPNEKQLKKHIEDQLDVLISKVDEQIKESNKGTTKGWIKQAFINALVDINDIKKGIPEYADAVIAELNNAQAERQLKTIVKKKTEQYFNKTFDVQDVSYMTRVLIRLATSDIETARVKLKEEVAISKEKTYKETWLLITLTTLLFVLAGFSKRSLPPIYYFLLLFSLLGLLVTGITIPMIDMEAKLSEISFVLLNHPIKFTDQVLYFQTKSILDVFWIMIMHQDLQMKIVGILMITFSIVIPLLKMFFSSLYYYNYRNARESKWVQFFVFKSGKWSMSDVLVVAIFMAYVGFNGIITSQFGNISSFDQDIVILTTNGTSLQPGFYIFLAYTILALFLSGFLSKKTVALPLNT